MNHITALEAVNAELARYGRPPLVMGELQQRAAFASLQEYAHVTQRPLDVAIVDMVRFRIQGDALEAARSQS